MAPRGLISRFQINDGKQVNILFWHFQVYIALQSVRRFAKKMNSLSQPYQIASEFAYRVLNKAKSNFSAVFTESFPMCYVIYNRPRFTAVIEMHNLVPLGTAAHGHVWRRKPWTESVTSLKCSAYNKWLVWTSSFWACSKLDSTLLHYSAYFHKSSRTKFLGARQLKS